MVSKYHVMSVSLILCKIKCNIKVKRGRSIFKSFVHFFFFFIFEVKPRSIVLHFMVHPIYLNSYIFQLRLDNTVR